MGVRPKILTALTVPSGGWDLDFTISNSSSLDTALTATISAGDYFVAWDSQSDDLIHEVSKQMRAAIVTAGLGSGRGVAVYIDSDRKVRIVFAGANFDEGAGAWGNDVSIEWSTSHADLVKALGADASDDFSSTATDYPVWTAPRPHAWGWYATEDGQLADLGKPRFDFGEVAASQSRALDGSTKTVEWAHRYRSTVNLGWLTAEQTWGDGQGYGDTPVYPNAYNEALECWWEEARKGTRFRVYESDPTTYGVGSGPVEEFGTNAAASATQVSDAGKAWGTDPQQFKDKLVALQVQAPSTTRVHDNRFFIASNTATALVSDESSPSGFDWGPNSGEAFYVYNSKYKTYVLDIASMNEFAPQEIPNLDRYNIEIPLLRYVA